MLSDAASREEVLPAVLRAPSCPIARPGDHVTWYQDTLRIDGVVVAHDAHGRAVVETENSGVSSRIPFASLRPTSASEIEGPIWDRLPSTSAIYKPNANDLGALRTVLNRIVPPGITHLELAREVWLRGFELFLTGQTLRQMVGGQDVVDAEFVTTMPVDRLATLLQDMYGREGVTAGEMDRQQGRLRVGGRAGTIDPAASIRLFRHDRPGSTDALFGASFTRDLAYSDFTCHSMFYEPENSVFIDPCGRALADAESRQLAPTYEATRLSTADQALIGLQVIHLRRTGYSIAHGSETQLLRLVEYLPAFTLVERAAHLQARVFGGAAIVSDLLWEEVHRTFTELGVERLWTDHILPCRDLLR